MKLLTYCLLCLFVTRMQSKPQTTKSFPVEELMAYYRQASNTTKSFDKFFERLRATYNFVFRQSDNSSNKVERILAKDTIIPGLTSINWVKLNDLRYPNNSFLNYVKSLLAPKNYKSKTNASNLVRDSSIEIKSTIRVNENANMSLTNSSEANFNNTLDDDDWFDDVQPLGQLELNDEEDSDKETDIKTVKPNVTFQLATTVGRYLFEWFGFLLGFTYNIYTKMSSSSKATQQ